MNRGRIERLFDARAILYRSTEATDDLGDVVRGWNEVATERCFLTFPRTPLKDYGAGEQAAGLQVLYLAAGSAAQPRDVVRMIEGPEAGTAWRVLSWARPRAHHVEAMVERWTGALPEYVPPVAPPPAAQENEPPVVSDITVTAQTV